MWVVVVFLKENSIAVVPKCWLMKDNTICTWPPVPNVKNYVLKRIEPEANWQIFGVRVLGRGKTYDNYLKARNAARVAEETSDINSETEYGKQKRKRKSKCISSSDSDSCLSDENDHINNNSNDSPYPSMPSVFLSSKSAESSRGTTPVLTKTSHHKDFENSTPSVFLSNKSAESSSGTTPVRAKTSHDRDFENSLLVPSTPNTENNNEPKDLILHRINRQYSIITFKLKNLENDIAGIMKHLSQFNNDNITESGFQYNIPIKSTRELKELDTFLDIQENYIKFVTFVQKIGGMSPYESVKRTMSRIMSDEVASLLCWNGSKTKEAFVGTNLQKGLTAGIQANLDKTSEKHVEESVKSWLRHAKARLNAKK